MQNKEFVERHLKVCGKTGDEWQCLCPYHDDTHPSFSVNVESGVFICFACGVKGTMNDLAVHLGVAGAEPSTPEGEEERLGRLQTALKGLRDDVAPSSPWDTQHPVRPESYLTRFNHAHDYWNQRGFSLEIQTMFGLGYDPIRNHGIIPLRSYDGYLVGIIRRQLEKDARPRYLYPRGFKISQHLFGAHMARNYPAEPTDRLAIVEGSLDCIACWDAGIPAVALLGSRLSVVQSQLLKKLGATFMVAMTDRDKAGREAARSLEEHFGTRMMVAQYHSSWVGKDPADLTIPQRREMLDSAL